MKLADHLRGSLRNLLFLPTPLFEAAIPSDRRVNAIKMSVCTAHSATNSPPQSEGLAAGANKRLLLSVDLGLWRTNRHL